MPRILLRLCVSDGSPTKEFKPHKGLGQGDMLTPFSFLIVAEGLAEVVKSVEEKNMLKRMQIGDSLVKVNMLYAGDTLFFCKAKIESVLTIKVILIYFQLTS